MKLGDRHHVFRILCALSASYLGTKSAEHKMSIGGRHTHIWLNTRTANNCQIVSPTLNFDRSHRFELDSSVVDARSQFQSEKNEFFDFIILRFFVGLFVACNSALERGTRETERNGEIRIIDVHMSKTADLLLRKLLHVIEVRILLTFICIAHSNAFSRKQHRLICDGSVRFSFRFVVVPPKRPSNESTAAISCGQRDSFDRYTRMPRYSTSRNENIRCAYLPIRYFVDKIHDALANKYFECDFIYYQNACAGISRALFCFPFLLFVYRKYYK